MGTRAIHYENFDCVLAISWQSKEFDQKMSLILGKASLLGESFSQSKIFF